MSLERDSKNYYSIIQGAYSMLKKLLAVLMSVALMIPTSIPASALSILSEGIPNTIVYSPEFPDAYITVEAGTSNRSSSNKTVKATVYVMRIKG